MVVETVAGKRLTKDCASRAGPPCRLSASVAAQYPSHGSVIDADEANRLGLSVTKLSHDDDLWQHFWLLRCMRALDELPGQIARAEHARQSDPPTVEECLL
jgi:hypothetical protein